MPAAPGQRNRPRHSKSWWTSATTTSTGWPGLSPNSAKAGRTCSSTSAKNRSLLNGVQRSVNIYYTVNEVPRCMPTLLSFKYIQQSSSSPYHQPIHQMPRSTTSSSSSSPSFSLRYSFLVGMCIGTYLSLNLWLPPAIERQQHLLSTGDAGGLDAT